MNKLFGFLTLAILVGFAFTNVADVVSYNVDVDNSKVNWKAYKVTGEHEGYVNLKEGFLQMTDGQLTGGQFVLDMTSITVTDLSGDMKGKLEGHLKSADFFGVENHNEARFVITKVIPQGPMYKVEGIATIKNIEKPIEFKVKVTEEGENVIATTEFQLDRSDFDVRYGSGSFFDNLGDKTIYDDFDLTVSLTAEKAAN